MLIRHAGAQRVLMRAARSANIGNQCFAAGRQSRTPIGGELPISGGWAPSGYLGELNSTAEKATLPDDRP